MRERVPPFKSRKTPHAKWAATPPTFGFFWVFGYPKPNNILGTPPKILKMNILGTHPKPNLAGSTVTMPRILHNLSQEIGLSEEEIIALVDRNPRCALGL